MTHATSARVPALRHDKTVRAISNTKYDVIEFLAELGEVNGLAYDDERCG